MRQAKKIYMATALMLALALTGCNQNEKKTESAAPEKPVAAAPAQEMNKAAAPTPQSAAAQPAAAAETAQDTLSGAVVETFDSGGYTYIQLDNGTKKLWAAIGQAKVKVGDKISLQNGPVMKDFHSKTLDRTFPEIIFSPGLAGAAPASHGGDATFSQAVKNEGGAKSAEAAGAGEEASGGSVKAITPVQEVKVDKAQGDNAYRVEELFASAAKLAGKKVIVRGKVVKVSPNIMGRNWIHLQDGTGNAMNNTHDLVVTSTTAPELNSIVTVEGTLTKDKDFGAGYFYNVIIEDATISK